MRLKQEESPKTALGISVGDVIKTGYGSGPYLVESISDPIYWASNYLSGLVVWPYLVISMICTYPNDHRKAKSYINEVHRDGSRWFTDSGDEIIVVSKAPELAELPKVFRQTDIFSLISPAVQTDNPKTRPYITDPHVDYSDRSHVFHCDECGHDFNGEKWNGGYACPYCPYCLAKGKHRISGQIIFMPAVIPGKNYPSCYQRAIGFTDQDLVKRQVIT